jgi:hypothetical protein
MMFRRLQIAAFRRSLPHSAVKMKLLQKLAPVACRSFKIYVAEAANLYGSAIGPGHGR